jgi:hypothetical protein
MGQDMTNIHLAPIEMDGGNQPVFIASDIEYNPPSKTGNHGH